MAEASCVCVVSHAAKVDSSECFDGTSGATPVAGALWSIILLVMLSLSSLA